MNANSFLVNYDQIADAPGADGRLRRFVLELAVRGKLLLQDPRDEPASDLVSRIAGEKHQVVKTGPKRKAKALMLAESDSVREKLPATWMRVPFGEVINSHLGGGTPSKSNPSYWNGEIPWASVKDIGKAKYLDDTIDHITVEGLANSSSNLIPKGSLIVVTRMGLGKVSINRREIAINQDLRALTLSTLVDIDYAYIFLKTHGFEGTGMTVKGIKVEELLSIPFPLPPLAEQHRITAKVDELMTLCDRLEAARTQREAVRDRLTASSLSRLNALDSDAFRDDVRFVLDATQDLTSRPHQINALRQAVLNLAVRGALVPQKSAELIERLPPAREVGGASDLDYEVFEKYRPSIVLPPSWQIAPLAHVSENIVDCPHTTPKWTPTGEICIRTNQLRPRILDLSDPRYVSQDSFKERTERLEPKADDILYSREGGILGIACRVPPGVRLCLGQRIMLIRSCKQLCPAFLEIVLNSPYITEIAKARTLGGAAPRVNMSTVRGYPIPVPPMAEQQMIVTRVNELMALCEQLEECLMDVAANRARLLESLLTEALAPAA